VLQDLKMLSPERRVDTAMWLFKGVSDSGPRVATQILLAERPEYVVDKITQALTFDPLFQDEIRRRYAFVVLAAKQEWPHPMTYELLTDGLLDYRVENVCRLALEQAPELRRAEAALVMATRLEQWHQNHGPATAVLLEIIGSYGGAGLAAADMVDRIFVSKNNRWPANRSLAAKTIAQIGGVARAVDKYRHMDTIQYSGALDGLYWLAELSPSPYSPNDAGTIMAQQIVVEALAVTSTTVVQKAIYLLPLLYSGTLYEPGKVPATLNPVVKSGLIAAAEQQSDPVRRDMVITTLRQYEAAPGMRGD